MASSSSNTAVGSPQATSSSSTQPTDTTPDTSSSAGSKAQSEARAAVLASLTSAGTSYTTALQSRAQDLHNNAAAIAAQQTQVERGSKNLAKESAKLEKEIDKTMKDMRELGDVQNWAEMLERDFMVLEETMRMVEGGDETGLESGGSVWR